MANRITRLFREVVGEGAVKARVTRLFREVVGEGPVTARVTRLYREVLADPLPNTPPLRALGVKVPYQPPEEFPTPPIVAIEEKLLGKTVSGPPTQEGDPPLLSDEAFFTPTGNPGVASGTVGLLADEAFFTPTGIEGAVCAVPLLNDESFFTPTANPGVVSCAVALLSDETFFTPGRLIPVQLQQVIFTH